MGRLLSVAGIAILVASGSAWAKPDEASHGKHERGYDKQPVGYGAGGCPPGLRRKNAQCLPPGQHKKLFDVGQRVRRGKVDGQRVDAESGEVFAPTVDGDRVGMHAPMLADITIGMG